MSFSLNTAGQFRANPEANLENALALVDENTPGTPATDSGTVDVLEATTITGVKYAGKDGVEKLVQFFREDQLTQKRTPFTLAAGSDPKVIQDAIYDVIRSNEVDAIVSVTKAVNTLTIEHTGAGTLAALVVDGTDAALSRAAIAAVEVQAKTAKTASKKAAKTASKKAAKK